MMIASSILNTLNIYLDYNMWQIQAMLQLIPAVVVYWLTVILFAGGILGYLISKFIKFIPFVNKYKLAVELISVLAITLGGYLYGGVEYRLKAQEMAEKVKKSEEEARRINDNLRKELDAKNKQILEQQAELRKRVKENAAKWDAECKVDPTMIETINDAAKGPKKKK